MRYLIANGRIADVKEINLNHLLTDASFRLTQKIWYGYGGIPLFDENLEQLNHQVEVHRLSSPAILNNRSELFRLTKRMLNKNRFYRSGYIHIQLFWLSGKAHTLITCNAREGFDFPFTENGILVAFASQKILSANTFNRFPCYNEMIWQAGLSAIQGSPLLQMIFLNEKDSLCECAHANLFLIKGDKMLTPALSTGCYEDVLRSCILEAANQAGLDVAETDPLGKTEIFDMDEVFIASEARGIQWILGLENKRFLRYYSGIIHERIIFGLKEKAML
jgi:hypothetical protein